MGRPVLSATPWGRPVLAAAAPAGYVGAVPLILFADDEGAFREALTMALEDAGFAVRGVADGRAALDALAATPPDLLLLDVNMPRLDGFTVCRRVREQGLRVPVVLLTSRDSEVDEALGLELGADDYVTKPVSARVLILRLQALLRRSVAPPAPPPAGRLHVDPGRLEVRWDGALVPTTVTEFRLVEALVARRGVVLSRDRLMALMRGDESVVDSRIVDTYVRRLRRAFEAVDPAFDHIETRVGAGYRWREP